ncbi:MAG TPA: zinc-ribbon domain-containing protein, partial [Pyrinomonadaceae bacterium]|nr:zinc-ribbon domain-containing protein [Pyrinomonadaceae bacterium]
MPESCLNCGAELYEGQQFCRRCGVQVGVPADGGGGDAPTQLFPRQEPQPSPQPSRGAAVGTSPVRPEAGPRVETGPVGLQQPTAYYPPANFQQTSPLVGQPFGSQPLAVGAPPAPKKRRGVWFLVLFVVFVLGAGLASAGAFLWWRTTHTAVPKVAKSGPPVMPVIPPIPDAPGVPSDLGDRIKEVMKSAGVPLPM